MFDVTYLYFERYVVKLMKDGKCLSKADLDKIRVSKYYYFNCIKLNSTQPKLYKKNTKLKNSVRYI